MIDDDRIIRYIAQKTEISAKSFLEGFNIESNPCEIGKGGTLTKVQSKLRLC